MKRLLVLSLLLLRAGIGHAETAPSQEDAITIGKLRFGISNQELLLQQSTQEEQALLEQLRRLNEDLAAHQRKLNDLKAKIDEQERILIAKEQELALIMRQNEALRSHLIKRLKAYYLRGNTGFVDITFSGRTLPELLLAQDAFRSLVTYDQELFTTYRESIIEIERVKQAKLLEKTVLTQFYADADGENAALAKTAAEQQELLRKVQLQKGLYEMALREMRKAESEMAASMQRQTPGTTTRSATTILQLKGQLPPPLWGEVVRRFQQTGDSDDPTFANGITIKTPPKTEVYAVHDGTVLFAGTMRGYGNVVIIDHRNHYFSVSARLEQMRVRQGATISKGQMIGTSGRHSDHPAEGLYFEIRRDAEAEDPLLWLRPGSLSLP